MIEMRAEPGTPTAIMDMGHRFRNCFLAVTAALFLFFSAPSIQAQARQNTPARAGAPGTITYTGAGSCNASNCHGSVWPKTGGKINQNEYNLWSSKDKHTKAYTVLLEPRSKKIARNLKIDKPETAAVCLDCHATNIPLGQQATSFQISDGVGCESCHGPAGAWLGPHVTHDWTHEQSVMLGMVDTKDVRKRTEVCLSCHLGNDTKTVDHDLIAAGHPALIFELETFSALMPAHWRKENEKVDTLHRWAQAQPISLRESVNQLQRVSAKADGWVDFAEFECMSCHHALVLPSARQERGYTGHAGLPPWNEARYVVLKHLMTVVSPTAQKELNTRIDELKKTLESPIKDRAATNAAAQAIMNLTNQALPVLEKATLNQQFANTLLRNITADATNIAWAGMRAAEQATMSVDVLYNAIHPGRPEDQVNGQIGKLYEMLQSQAAYNPEEFAVALRRLGTLF
jgi:cytochrome c554/c'-like protein